MENTILTFLKITKVFFLFVHCNWIVMKNWRQMSWIISALVVAFSHKIQKEKTLRHQRLSFVFDFMKRSHLELMVKTELNKIYWGVIVHNIKCAEKSPKSCCGCHLDGGQTCAYPAELFYLFWRIHEWIQMLTKRCNETAT